MTDKDAYLDEEDIIESTIRKRQVATVRNKAYIFFLGLFLFVFRPTFLTPIETIRGEGAFSLSITDPINGFFHNRGLEDGGLLELEEKLEEDIEKVDKKIEKIQIEKTVIEHLSNKEKQQTLINCINDNNKCVGIDSLLIKQLDFLRIFIIIGDLQAEKMDFNQKVLLRNINEFILKSPTGQPYGDLINISFGKPKIVNEEFDIRSIQLRLGLEVSGRDNLINFLDNIENKVYLDLPILYIVDGVSYDFVKYTEEQEVGFTLGVYYFGDSFDSQIPLGDDDDTGTVEL